MENLKRDAIDIFLAGVAAVEPGRAVASHLSLLDGTLVSGQEEIRLTPDTRIFVVGAGKAGAPMAAAVEGVLGELIHRGLVVVKYGHLAPVRKISIREAAHPVPDEAGLSAAREMTELLAEAGEGDLVICLLSGGGSALLPCPVPAVTLADKQSVTNLLLASGAEIAEINCIRKHLSLFKGGGLARLAYPAKVVTLILSDVVGDPLDVIASGPAVGDPTTFSNALAILDRYQLTEEVPAKVLTYLSDGAAGLHPETPKPGDPELEGVINILVGTNTIAVNAAQEKAESLGYNTTILSTSITGDTGDAAASHVTAAREILYEGRPVPPPACALSGGETTVVVRGGGKGGRNQEFALAAGIGIDGLEGVAILSGGTDGTDGPTDAAGAIADGSTAARARTQGLDPAVYLADNDAYHFFEKLGDLLITGPTLTNVMDLRVVLVGEKDKG
jgi:hydroxypyruvate reductase